MMPLALVRNALASIIRAGVSPRYSMAAMMAGAVMRELYLSTNAVRQAVTANMS